MRGTHFRVLEVLVLPEVSYERELYHGRVLGLGRKREVVTHGAWRHRRKEMFQKILARLSLVCYSAVCAYECGTEKKCERIAEDTLPSSILLGARRV